MSTDRGSRVDFYNHHISKLEKELQDLYTIKNPVEELRRFEDETVNILEDLEWLRKAEEIYNVMELSKIPEGKTYEEYRGYLDQVRKGIQVMQEEKKKVESANAAQIENINLILKSFKDQVK